jgi:hypothetical protein
VLSTCRELRASVRLSSSAKEPGAAATAIFRIEALAAEPFPKPLRVRRIGETENTVRDNVAPHRVPTRTERKPTAEFVDDVMVLAHDLIGGHRDLVRPFAVDPACAQFTFAPGRPFKQAKLSLGQQQRMQAQRAKAIPYSAHR